jgi:hypothetical protein
MSLISAGSSHLAGQYFNTALGYREVSSDPATSSNMTSCVRTAPQTDSVLHVRHDMITSGLPLWKDLTPWVFPPSVSGAESVHTGDSKYMYNVGRS